tara:strand:+ start:704 stop:1000 length:297 start_codon:yes stop_codon:yes gene_type:complete
VARRKKNKVKNDDPNASIITEKCGDWKKKDEAWFKAFDGEWHYGQIMYFVEGRTDGKKYVTFWDEVDPRYRSSWVTEIHKECPDKKIRDKISRKISKK